MVHLSLLTRRVPRRLPPLGLLAAGALLALSGLAPAVAQYDPRWRWCTVSNEHFTLYYPAGHESFAQRVLSLTDEVHRDVSGYLGVKPRRCPVVLNPGTDLFNGFMSVLPNRVSLYETPLYTVRGFGPGSDLVDLVFTHEYTHYAHITTRLGWYGRLATWLGDGLAISNGMAPGWVIEGVTTWNETQFTDGGRGRCALFRGRMRSFAAGPGLWGLSAAGTPTPYAPPGDRMYAAGYHLVEYLNRAYGADAAARLGRYQALSPLRGTRGALGRITGVSPRRFYREFRADFDAQAQQALAACQAQGLPAGQPVMTAPLDAFPDAFWTERGTLVAVRVGYGRPTALVEVDPATGVGQQETRTGRLAPVSGRRLPDGRLLLCEVYPHPLGPDELTTTDLVLFDPATRRRQRLTRGQHLFRADLAPDGRAVVATRREGMWTGLVLLDADGGNLRSLVSLPGVYFDAPCWSPDGRRIAAVAKSGPSADIVLVDPATGAMELLFAADLAEDNDPAFSPDGRWLVFASSRSGVWNIHAWDLQGHRLYQVTSVPYAATSPRVSPDGRSLSFTRLERGLEQVCVLPFAPEQGRLVIVGPAGPLPPADLARLQPEVNFQGRSGIPWQAYKPFVHVPWYSRDEVTELTGVLLAGADPIGRRGYNALVAYDTRAQRLHYDVTVSDHLGWPAVFARAYDQARSGSTPDPGRRYHYRYRERGGEAGVGLAALHRLVPSRLTSAVRAGVRLRRYSSLEPAVAVDPAQDQSLAVFGELQLARATDAAPRDLVPGWGQRVAVAHEQRLAAMGGDLPGHDLVLSASQYVPGLFAHQGLELHAACQLQGGQLFHDKTASIPRGYDQDDAAGGLNLRRNLLLRAEYHFPLGYTDVGYGLLLYHSYLLRGSLFADWGAGWRGRLDAADWADRARCTVGATLTDRAVFMGLLPLEYGLEAGWKTRERQAYARFLARTWF
jgi:hypothetical protein